MKKIYKVIFTFSIITIFLFNVDIVCAVNTNYEDIPDTQKSSIWLGKNNGTGVGKDKNQLGRNNCPWLSYADGACRFREGRLKIDNQDAFCANPAIKFGAYKEVTGQSFTNYLQNTLKISKSDAQNVVTEIALYKKYFYSANLSSTQKYYLTQTRVWTVLHRYYHWFGERNADNMNYWIEVWNNPAIFNGAYGTSICDGESCPDTSAAFINNTKWEQNLFAKAKEYVDQNKSKYIGEAQIWITKQGNYQPLIEVNSLTLKLKASYDYSIDAACVGCDVKGLDNRAMIIQDTTDWEAIMNSRTQTLVKSAQNYYYDSDSGSYCREEYRVKLPDSSKEITVKPGKYLTVGALKKELEKLTKGTANVGPVEVTKIIQCKGGDLNKRRTLNEQRCFINKNGSKSKSLGTIKLQYEECGDNRKYNGDIDLVPNFKEGFPSVNSSISVDDGKEMLTQSQTVSYTLPSNTYRYVRNQDGLSIKSLSSIKANDLNTKYRDLGFSTLPISFDNEGDSVKVKANLHFEYTLPEHGDGAYSAIKKAYGTKNYFKSSGNAVDNVYKKYTKGDAKAKTQINKSACNKLYGTTNQACINSHVNDKTADCKNINKISSDKTGSCEKAYSQNGYVCPVKIPPIPACPPGECPPEDPPCENGRPRCADGTCPVDGEECKPCEDDLCTDVPGIDVIYRPIDLANPFPGQKGSKTKSRKTGANWCEYNQKTGKLNCSANNAVSKKYIINKKVYNDNHVLYKVTLDANTISKVRNYNKNKKYDDFDLKCKDGKACISDFLNNVINVEGKCSKVNHGNFYTCNK